jgi:hypothetical protein
VLVLALALAAVSPPSPPNWYGGRIYTSASVHVGMRPAVLVSAEELAAGVTVQVSWAGAL